MPVTISSNHPDAVPVGAKVGDMKIVRACDLSGVDLEWAFAQVIWTGVTNYIVKLPPFGYPFLVCVSCLGAEVTDRGQVYRDMDRHIVNFDVAVWRNGSGWRAAMPNGEYGYYDETEGVIDMSGVDGMPGKTLDEAVARCIVSAKIGREVTIPTYSDWSDRL